MGEALLDQVRDEQVRMLVKMSLPYWKERTSSYEKWREYKTRAVARLNEVEAKDDAYFRVVMRSDLLEQSKRLPQDVRRLYEAALWRSLRRLRQEDRPARDRSEAAIRETYLTRVAQIAELEAATASAEAWDGYVDQMTEESKLGAVGAAGACVLVCGLVCVVAWVGYEAYKCLKHYVCPPTPTPTPTPPQSGSQSKECEEVEVCEEVWVEEEQEVCEEECHEECPEE